MYAPLTYKEAKSRYKEITSDPDHRMYGYSRRQFAKEAEEILGDRRFNTLQGGGVNRALWHVGQTLDNIAQFDLLPFEGEQSLGTGMGGLLQLATGAVGRGWLWGKDDQQLSDSLMRVGRELPSALGSFAMFAIPWVGVPLGLASMYGDAYNDALEEGRSVDEATGAGGLNVVLGAVTGGMGRFLGQVGKTSATKTSQKLVAKSLGSAGITHSYQKKLALRKLNKLNEGKKWYQPRKGLNVRMTPGKPGKVVKLPSGFRVKSKELLISQGGMTTFGVGGDILDTALFNDQLGVDQLLTDPNYLIPMLAGDSVTYIGGSQIVNRIRDRKIKDSSKRIEKQKALRDAQQRLIARAKAGSGERWMGPQVETDRHGNYSPEWLDTLKLEDHPGVHFAQRENINEHGDVEYVWYDATNYSRDPAGELGSAERLTVEQSAPELISYKTDNAGRIYDVKASDPANFDLLMIALRRQFGGEVRVGPDGDVPSFVSGMGPSRHGTFQYITKEDNSDRPFIEQVLTRFGQVDRTAPNVLTVTDMHTVHSDVDARRRAARHMEYWDGMPVKQEYQHFVERFARAAQMQDAPMNTVRREARRIYKFYRSKGLGEDMAMRLSLRTVERTGYQSFYNIYYGDAAKSKGTTPDTDLERVLRYDMTYNGLNVDHPVMRVGREQNLVEFSDTAGVVFYHDADKRETLRLVYPKTTGDGKGTSKVSIEFFTAGVKVRNVDLTVPGRPIHMARHMDDFVASIPEGTLTTDQGSALTLALGQLTDIGKTPGVTYGKRITTEQRKFVDDIADGFGLSDSLRLIVVNKSDLRDPVTLREMGLPVLSMFANASGVGTGGTVFYLKRGKPGELGFDRKGIAREENVGINLIVINDQLTVGEDFGPFGVGLRRADIDSKQQTLIHELGHVVHRELFDNPAMGHFQKEVLADYDAHVAKLQTKIQKKLGKKISELKKDDIVPGKWLKNFMDNRILRGYLWQHVGIDENGKLNPVTTEDLRAFIKDAQLRGSYVKYAANFQEWMAEQFVKYSQKKTAPVRGSVDKFFKELSDMWTNVYQKVFKGDVDFGSRAYQDFMKHAHYNFYTNIMRSRHGTTLDMWKTNYKLSDGEGEYLSRKLWESDYHPHLVSHLEYQLDLWMGRKKSSNFNSLVHRAISAHKSGATMILDPTIIQAKDESQRAARLQKLNEIFFGLERAQRYGEYEGAKAEEIQQILKTIDRALFGTWTAEKRPDLTTAEAKKAGYALTLDPTGFNPGSLVNATELAQVIVARWLQGDLTGQKSPRDGGTELLRGAIEREMKSYRSSVLEKDTLKTDANFGSKKGVQYFTELNEPRQIVERLTNTHGNEAFRFEVQSRTKKVKDKDVTQYFIVRKYDEMIARRNFDENHTYQYDGLLRRSTSERVVQANLENLGHDREVAVEMDAEFTGDIGGEQPKPINDTTFYRGTQGDPQALPGEHAFFSESESFAGSYGTVGTWRISPENPKIITQEEWGDSILSMWTMPFVTPEMKQQFAMELLAEGHDAIISEAGPKKIKMVYMPGTMGKVKQAPPPNDVNFDAEDVGGAINDAIKRGVDNGLLPSEILEQFDAVIKELDDAGGRDQLDAIARDFGDESVNSLNDLISLVLGHSFKNPTKTAEIISLLPDKTKNLLRDVLTFGVDLADSVEVKVRAANVELKETGNSLDVISDVKSGLAKAAEEKSDIGPMSTMMARLHPGGVSEANVEGGLWRAPFRWLEKLYGQTFAGIQHYAESHPLIRDASTSLYMETGLQNKIYSDITDQLHAVKPPVPGDPLAEVDYKTDDPNRSFRVVSESPKLSDAYNQIRLLEQTRGQGMGDLLRKNDKELVALMETLDPSQQQAIADLVQRGHKAQEILTEYRNQTGREIDRISGAKFLLKKSDGSLTSREAVGMIERLDSQLEEGTPTVLEDAAWELSQSAGIDLGQAELVTMFFARLKAASAELHAFLSERPFYVSERRMKQFHVSYVEKGDKTTSLADFDSLVEAEAFAAEVTKAGGTVVRGRPIDTRIQASLRNSGARDMLEALNTATAKRKAVIDEMFGDIDPDTAKEINLLLDELETDVSIEKEAQSPLAVLKASEGKKRKFKGGRERFNMLEQQLEHSRRVGVGLARRRSDSLISLVKQDRDAQSDQGQELIKLVEQAKTNMRNPDPAAAVAISKFNFAMFLGMNWSSALIEVFQFPLTLTPILRELGAGAAESITTPTSLYGASVASFFSSRKEKIAGSGWTDSEHIEIIRRAEKEGRLNIRRYVDVEDDIVLDREAAARVGRGEDMRGDIKTWNPFSLAYRLGARMYAPFNRLNAELSLISIYETLKKHSPELDSESLYTQSVRWADLANGSAGKANRPVGLFSAGTPAVRTLAQSSFGLMSFTNAAVSNWMRWVKKSQSEIFSKEERKAARGALTQAVALHVVGLGALGVPMAATINTLFANLFGVDMEDAVRDALTFEDESQSDGVNDFWANFALYGAMHATGMAPDIQTRLAVGGMAGLNPYSGWEAVGAMGPAASYAVNTVRALGEYHEQGTTHGDKMLRTATNLIPIGLRKAAQLTLTDEGQVRNRQNRFITTPTDAEKAAMIMGFRPRRVRDEQTRLMEISRAQNSETRTRRRVVSEALGYLRDGSLEKAQRTLLHGAADQEGTSYSQLYSSFEDRALEERYGKGYNAGTVTSSKISAQGVGRHGRPTNMQVYLDRLNLRGNFGMNAMPSRNQMMLNQRADDMMRQNPFMTSANAKRLAREERMLDQKQRSFSPQGFSEFWQPGF